MKKGELLGKAIVFATNAHAGQFDRGGKPYILHTLSVMRFTEEEFGFDEELLAIAVLHDTVEDTKTTWKDLNDEGFTERMILALKALTKVNGQTYDEYQEGVFANVDAMKVKMNDLRHNSDIRRLKGVTEKDIERLAKYSRFFIEIQARLKEM